VRTIVWDFNVLDVAMVSQAQQSGFQVYAYGMIAPGEHRSCRQWKLDGIITDFPEQARQSRT
jgi:glycerophosphoryl diester phosphodiesterase